ELLKKTWFWEKTPNPSTSSRSTTAIQSAGCRENESPATPKPRPKSGASGAGSVTGTVSPASIRRLQGRAKHRRHDHRDRRLFAAEVGNDGAVAQDDDPMRERQHPRHVVRYEEHAQPAVCHRAYGLDDDLSL